MLPAESQAAPRFGLISFAYVLVPVNPRQTGVRSFCGDASGVLCYKPDGSEPAVVNGQCPADCRDLR